MSDGVNVPLLRKAVEWAETEAAKPIEVGEWVQGRYILPLPDGPEQVVEQYGGADLVSQDRQRFGKGSDCGTCFCIAGKVAFDETGNMDYFRADAVASEALGLTGKQASALFSSDNSIEDVRRIAEEIAGERL